MEICYKAEDSKAVGMLETGHGQLLGKVCHGPSVL